MSTVSPGEGLFVRLKEVAGHTLVYGLGSAAQALTGLLLLPIYGHYFTTAEFGILSLITLSATLAGSVFYLGGASALARSYYDYDTASERRRTVTTALALTLLGAAMQLAFAAAFASRLSELLFGTREYELHIFTAMASSVATFISGLFLVVLRFERRSVSVVLLNVAALVLTTGTITWMLFGLGLGLMAPIAGGLVAQGCIGLAMAWMVRGHLTWGLSRREVGLQLRYGFGAVCIGAAYYVLDGVDRILLGEFSSLSDVGIYSMGYRLGMIIHILFITPFLQIWTPMRLQYRNEAGARELFKLVLTYYSMIGLLATVAITIFSREIILFAGAPEYLPAYRVVPVIMLAHLAYGAVGIVDAGIIFSRKVHYHVIIFVAAVILNVGLNLLLIPRWGYMAAAYVTLFSYLVVTGAAFVVANFFYPADIEGRRIAVLLSSAVLTLAAGSTIPEAWPEVSIAGRLILLLALGTFWFVFVLTGRERSRILQLTTSFV